MQPIVGIDLGTTNSLCAFFDAGKPTLIRNANGRFLTPSVVGFLPEGKVVVGQAAKELRVTQPDCCCALNFKRWMGANKRIRIADHSFSAIELSSLVLKSLKEDAENHIGTAIGHAVISVPAYFNDDQRSHTRQAGKVAGLEVLRIINEPTAAALTYGFHDPAGEKKIVVIDLGGGTFNVTVMEIFEGSLEIIATAGESSLGGEDFTDRLVATVLNKMNLQLEQAELQNPLMVARLRQECEQAKQTLADEAEASVRIPDGLGDLNESSNKVKVTRENFAKVSSKLMDRLRRPIEKALRDGDAPSDSIDDVILVGGATRMSVVRDAIEQYFQRPPICTYDPDQVVALGCAVQAALINDDKAVDDMVMTDVCPFTLGVEIVKQFGNQIKDGYFSPVLHRNTTIPVSTEEIYGTAQANQTGLLLQIYQGESRKVKDNLKIGELEVTGIPPGPANQEVCVRFTYDLNGILEVEAYLSATGKRFATVLKRGASDLSDREIKAAVEKMQGLKFYPRDDLENQRLLLFAERVVGEIDTFHRQELEETIDQFEQAMRSGDRELFNHVRDGLCQLLSRLGFEPSEEEDTHHGGA